MTDPGLPAPLRSAVAVAARLRMAAIARWASLVDLIAAGGGYAFGPATFSSSPGLSVLKHLPVTIPQWGFGWLIAAVLILAAPLVPDPGLLRMAGHYLAALIFAVWGFTLLYTIFFGEISGIGAPFHHLMLAVVHLGLAAAAMWDRGIGTTARGRRQGGR